MRPPKPQEMIDYERAKSVDLPRCCHACDRYREDGLCEKYYEPPPADFVAIANNDCRFWLQVIPF